MTTKLLVCFFLSVATTEGQIVKGFGLKAGLVSANQNWEYAITPPLETDNRLGVTAGVFLEGLASPFLSILAELRFTQKGMSWTIPITTETQPNGTGRFITMRTRVSYVAVPILVRLRLPTDVVEPYILVGPRIDFLLSNGGDGFEIVLDKFRKTELNTTLGVGVEAPSILPVALMVEFRYNPSLNDSYSSNFLRVRNRSFDFLVGVRF